MNKTLNYVTYQNFPAETANSLQTISNIRYLLDENVKIKLYFPLREINSSSDLMTLQKFYSFKEEFEVVGINHKFPFGKIKFLEGLWFHISHLLWSRNTIKAFFKNDIENTFLTRSDWVAYFLAKQGSKVVIECHQTSKLRNYIYKKLSKFENVKFIFLNENLLKNYNFLTNSIVLQNGVDNKLFDSVEENKIRNKIIFVGNLARFNESRGLLSVLEWFQDYRLKNNYQLEIIGGNKNEVEIFKQKIQELKLESTIKVRSWITDRIEIARELKKSSFGLLINTPYDKHSYYYTSPLKYFEYLYSELKVIATNYPAHQTLPYIDFANLFSFDDKESFINALKVDKKNNYLNHSELKSITLENRAKKIVEFIF